MPPRRVKVDHRRGGGSKHVSSVEDVKARNNGEMSAYDKARAERKDGKAPEEDDSSSEEEEEKPKAEEKPKVKKPSAPAETAGAVHNPNAVKRNEEKEGVELTRKQREELDKASAQRRYQELHKAGKTDEAKADLGRLEEVKKRRAEAAQKKIEDDAAAAAKELEKGKKKSGMTDAVKEAMGGEAARMRGDRSKAARGGGDKDGDREALGGGYPTDAGEGGGRKIINGVREELVYSTYISDAKEDKERAKESLEPKEKNKGTIEACRAAEEDFM
mmetsp:Transcript_65896/g.172671  ORF Transcript_65896/g.172671 Transcript_65896/m.172671 type:complete len:274 (-) Transcript_65896:73-894(-)